MNISKDHIIQYLNGELPHYEQHEIEKLMLDDPFLSDAIEGLKEVKNPEILNEALKELEGFIEDNYGKVRKVVPLYRNPMAIAAVITLIFVSVAVVYFIPDYREKALSFLIPEEKNEEINPSMTDTLDNSKYEEESGLAKMDADTSLIPDADESSILALSEDIGNEDISAIDQPAEANQTIAAEVITTDELIENREASAQIITSPDTIPEAETERDFVDNTEQLAEAEDFEPQPLSGQGAPAAKKSVALEGDIQMAVAGKAISGTIVSAANNQPLAGVNVFLTGTSRGMITNNSGSYEMQLEEDQNQLEVTQIGFQPARVDVSQPGSHNVSLQNNTSQISEFNIIGSIGETRLNGSDQFAIPETGHAAYNQYISNNLNYPLTAAESGLSGLVIIEFTVLPNGNISDIQVINSLGSGCDEEAARLIQEGPGWRAAVKNGIAVSDKVRIAIRFGAS